MTIITSQGNLRGKKLSVKWGCFDATVEKKTQNGVLWVVVSKKSCLIFFFFNLVSSLLPKSERKGRGDRERSKMCCFLSTSV